MIDSIIYLPRRSKQLMMILADSILLVLILLFSFSLILGHWYWPEDANLLLTIFSAPLIAFPIFARLGLYLAVIRYVSFNALWAILQAVSLYALVWGVVGFMVAVDGVPRSVIFINWVLSLLAIGGVRVIARVILSENIEFSILNFKFKSISDSNKKQVLVYGAGDAGVQLVSALVHSCEYNPVGFIDDEKELHGKQIRGLSVYSVDDINRFIANLKIDEILIAMPSASRGRRNEIINLLESYPIHVRMLPGVAELAEGKVSISDLHEVSIKDLLGRNQVEANKKLLSKNITNKVVVVTGAGGSIGSELCWQISLLSPKVLILYELSEYNLYKVNQKLSTINSQLKGGDKLSIMPILGSVNNKNRFKNVLEKFGVDTIYHAAAYKHVPMVEFNSSEGVSNNIFGTLNCAQAAIETSVETFVLISTDKAVRPTNTMGATKRSAELVLQALSAEQSITKFTIVRFGNVLGSSGSVIPLFKQQIKDGGPITVTDKDIIRYFMTISEAVELVIQAGAMGLGGDVFVLDMGKPVRIDDLAKKMIHLSGLEVKDESHPNGDIEIRYTGLRPGEKLYEELLIGDNVSSTDNPLIMRAQENMIYWNRLEPILNDMRIAVDKCKQERLRELLIKLVPDFKPQCGIEDILYKKIN